MKYTITAGKNNNKTNYSANKFNEALDIIESLEERDSDNLDFKSGNYGILNNKTRKHVKIF